MHGPMNVKKKLTSFQVLQLILKAENGTHVGNITAK